MANYKILLVLSVVVCLGKSDSESTVPIKQGDIHIAPGVLDHNNTTTAAPIPTSTSSNVTTTAPNTTTISPKTSTITPNTTTLSPNTTTVSPNTTTVAPTTPKPTPGPVPNTTTVAPPTTSKPVPDIGKWTLNYTNSNQSCLVMDATLEIEILVVNSTSKKIDVPISAAANGICDKTNDVLHLTWENNTLTMNFNKKVNDSKFELEYIKLSLPDGPNNTLELVHNKSEFSTLINHSYKCAKLQNLNLTLPTNNNITRGYLHISNAQFQAFSNVTGHQFNEAIDCEASHVTSDVVPIVVGCVLAVLVIVILVAYLFGRRRCQARGYLSM